MTSMACEEEVNRHEARQKAKRLAWKPRSARNLLRMLSRSDVLARCHPWWFLNVFFVLAHLDSFGRFFNTWIPELLITAVFLTFPARIDRLGSFLRIGLVSACCGSKLLDVGPSGGFKYFLNFTPTWGSRCSIHNNPCTSLIRSLYLPGEVIQMGWNYVAWGQCLVHNGTKSCGSSGPSDTRDVVGKAGGRYTR